MPKIREPAIAIQNRCISETIRYGLRVEKVKPEELAKYIGVSYTTFYNRLKNPGEFRLVELRAICKRLHIDLFNLIQEKAC